MAIATLSIDMVAKLGELQAGMDRAGRISEQNAERIEARYQRMAAVARSVGAALGGAVSIAGIAAFVTRTAEAGAQIDRLAQLSAVNVERFQQLSFAARTVGVDQDKLGDILKDVQDKVGDFLQTGGGPLADFFTKIAPKVGVTAQQFARLGGAEALQLYVSSLEKANLSQSELVFFLEAIASDSSRLLPLLQNNGAEFERLGQRAREAGAVLSEGFIRNSRELQNNLEELQTRVGSLALEISGPLIKSLNQLFAFVERSRQSQGGLLGGIADQIGTDFLRARIQAAQDEVERLAPGADRARGVLSRQPDSFRARATLAEFAAAQRDLEEKQRELEQRMGYANGARRPANEGGGRLAGLNVGGGNPPAAARPATAQPLSIALDPATQRALQAIQATDVVRIQEINDALEQLFSQRAGGLGGGPEIDQAIENLRDELQKLDPASKAAAAAQAELNALLAATPSGQMAALAQQASVLAIELAKATDPERVAQLTQALEQTGEKMRGLGERVVPVTAQLSEFAQQAARNIQDALGDSLLQGLEGKFETIGELWANLLKRMAAQALAAQLNRAILGDSFAKTGQIGGGAAALIKLLPGMANFSGFFATGGRIPAGQWGIAGEAGPEVVHGPATVIPMGGSGAGGPVVNQTNYFGSNVSRGEVALAAAQAKDAAVAEIRALMFRTGRGAL